jgi:hypothetical protein
MPAGSTYSTIATQTLSSATNLVTFSSIPSTYTDLIFICTPGTAQLQDMYFRVNGDSGSNYSWTHLFGTGSTTGSVRSSGNAAGMADYYGAPNLTVGNSNQILQFMNYSNTTTFKTILTRSNRADSGTDLTVNLWKSTAAINEIQFRMSGGATINFLAGSTFTLYGIAAA